MAAKLQPMADRVLVKPIEKEEKTKSGIYLPDTAKEKPQEGKILAVGPGKMSDDGKRIPMDLKVGDTVIYAKYGGTEIKVDDDEIAKVDDLKCKGCGVCISSCPARAIDLKYYRDSQFTQEIKGIGCTEVGTMEKISESIDE